MSSTRRLHDLDALRGFAMLLGIGLHACLAFIPGFWPVQDATASFDGFFDEFLWLVHGFRMPVFFLLSGFFTAMLWHRRGLRRLLWHRFLRIVLPLVLCVFTIIPLVEWVSERAIANAAKINTESTEDVVQLWEAVGRGDDDTVSEILDRGIDVNIRALDGSNTTLLHTAAYTGQAAVARLLIERGADPNAISIDGDSPLHTAAFTGDAATARVLLEAGAKWSLSNSNAATPFGIAYVFANSEVAEVLVKAGKEDPRAQGQDWSELPDWGLLADSPEWAFRPVFEGKESVDGISDPDNSNRDSDDGVELESWIAGFHHLWFLWFLCWFVAGFAILTGLASLLSHTRRSDTMAHQPDTTAHTPNTTVHQSDITAHQPDTAIRTPDTSVHQPDTTVRGSNTTVRLVSKRYSQWLIWMLIPMTLIPQLAMSQGGQYRVFGPDTSDEVLPPLHLLAYYALFFAFGALMYSQRSNSGRPLIEMIGRGWQFILPITALVVSLIGLGLTFEGGPWLLASMFQVAYAWGMTFGLIGLFQRILGTERRWVRYVSDSSYWLYIAHLPLIIATQSWVANWDMPALIKFMGICLGCTALLLASYQLLVRHTPIGWLLNGRRLPTK